MATRSEFDSADAKRELWRETERVMRTFGEVVLGEAVRNAPIEEGTLRGSGETKFENTAGVMPRDGSRISVEISFDTPYALVQHERTDFHHPKGGGPKYLENAIKTHARRLEAALAAGIDLDATRLG